MAAATMAGLEERKLEYFSSINSMAKKIMQEREKIKAQHGACWEKMSATEQDDVIDNSLMEPHIRARYAMHRVDREEVVCYPKLLLHTGQKIVHFGDEDITWQDEHSAPFSWETKSQLEFSLISGPADQGVSSKLSQGNQGVSSSKLSQGHQGVSSSKLSQGNQLNKSTTGNKQVCSSEGEESSFWKISAEGETLTPSQIKSLEKGEKPLPSYLRQDPTPAETLDLPPPPPPPAPVRSAKQRAPKPPAPLPPAQAACAPAAISITPDPPPPTTTTTAGWERAQSTLPSVSNALDEMFSSSLMAKPPPRLETISPRLETISPPRQERNKIKKKKKEEEEEPASATGPAFAQFNTSSSILKTGFDFLDNW